MSMIKTALLTLIVLSLAVAGAGAVVVYAGLYNVAATVQHTQFVYSLLETAMRQAVRLRASGIDVPPLNSTAMISKGAACYADKCVQCHGGPGVAQGDVGKSLQPLPGPLVDASQRWKPEQLYWITRHGIRMSGMPAWQFRLEDSEIWELVAFMQKLPQMTPAQYVQATAQWRPDPSSTASTSACGLGMSAATVPPAATVAGAASVPISNNASPIPGMQGDASRGKVALYQYACSACHTIPGIVGSSPNVGPPLSGMASRSLIAGKLTNTHENMVRWLRETKQVDPLTAMPQLGVSEAHANDMAAYLATLR